MKIGSLFSGYGGLDMAAEAVFGGTTAWHSEVDQHASKVLALRWPGVPNLGDIAAVDWSTVEPVDVIAGGFPCQDISSARPWCRHQGRDPQWPLVPLRRRRSRSSTPIRARGERRRPRCSRTRHRAR